MKKKPGNPTGKGGPVKGGPSRNPNGRPPLGQSFNERAAYIFDNYSVYDVIENVKAIASNDKKKMQSMATRDFAIFMRIAETFKQGGGDSLELLLNRMYGKPSQSLVVDQTIKGTVTTRDERHKEATDEAAGLLNKVITTRTSKNVH